MTDTNTNKENGNMHSLVLYTQQTRTKKIRKHKSCYGLVACYNTRPENNIGLFEDPETTGGTDYDENCTEECMRYPSDKQKEFKMVQCRLTCFSSQNVGPPSPRSNFNQKHFLVRSVTCTAKLDQFYLVIYLLATRKL